MFGFGCGEGTATVVGPRPHKHQPQDDGWRDLLDDDPGSVRPPRNDG